MKYILELEDEPNKEYFGEGNYYRCKQIPYWSISESMRNRLEPYDEADGKKRVMTLEQNITAILESCFSGFRSELIEACAKRIMEQIERQADTPQTEDDYFLELMDAVERGEMSDASANQAYYEYINRQTEEADTPQTEDYDFRDEQEYNDRWQTDCDRYVITNDEGDKAYNCIGCTQTDCGWK